MRLITSPEGRQRAAGEFPDGRLVRRGCGGRRPAAGGVVVVWWNDGMRDPLHRRAVEFPSLFEHPIELALGFHQPEHGRSGEVGERAGVTLAVV